MQATFGTAAVLIAPSAPLLSTGYVPGNTLAAQHLNYYLFHLTKELNNLLALAGISPSGAVDTQVGAAVQWVATAGVTVLLTTGSPYTLAAYGASAVEVNGTANPYIINLPQASTCIGYCVEVLDVSTVGSGLVRIVPYSGDAIGQLAADTAVYLQNVDAGGAKMFQSIRLRATATGWVVVGGQFCPHQTVDTDGSQIHMGRWIHLPNDTTTRDLYGSSGVPAAPPVSGFSPAIQAAGLCGIPLGAKAIRARMRLAAVSSGAGSCNFNVIASSNNSATPGADKAMALGTASGYAHASSDIFISSTEIEIILNASGQFYISALGGAYITLASCGVEISALSYCMGY